MTTINLLEKLDRESDVVDELRHHLELVLEGFLAGPLDTAPVSKIVANPGYEQLLDEFRPKLNEAFVSFLSALLYALKTSLIDVELIDHRAYDLSAAHERLKNLINSLKSAVDLWLRKLPEEPKLVAREQAADKASLTYENALAMSCVNKVLLSSLSKNKKSVLPEIKLGEGDYSYESSTTLTVFCDGEHDDWRRSSKVDIQKEFKENAEEDRLKTFCAGAGGGVPFPEYGVDIVDCGWWGANAAERVKHIDAADHPSPAAVPMTSTEWEDNWLFRRKIAGRMEAFNLEPVQMVIPKPKNPGTGITLGSLDIDALSELSENNSVASLDFSSTESESDRPQVTGAVMKPLPQARSTIAGPVHGNVTVVSEQSTTSRVSARQPSSGTTIVTVNGSSDHGIVIETPKHNNNNSNSNEATQTLVSGKPPVATSASRRDEPSRPLIGPRAKATFDGKVVMENIEEIKDKSIHQGLIKCGTGGGGGGGGVAGDDSADQDRRTPQGRSSVAYDEFSVQAFQEETLQSLEEHLEFKERIDTTGTTNSLRSFSEEELDVHTSVSTEFSFRRSPEGCSSSAEPQSQMNTPNLTRMYIGKSSASTEALVRTSKRQTDKRSSLLPRKDDEEEEQQLRLEQLRKHQHNVIMSDHQHNHDDHHSRSYNNRSSVDSGGVADVADVPLPPQKIRSLVLQPKEAATTTMKTTMTAESEDIAVSASVSSGRGSTASTDSASSVQSYDLAHRDSASASRLSETSLDQDRSISAEPPCHEHELSHTSSIVQQRPSERFTTTCGGTDVTSSRCSSTVDERAGVTTASEQTPPIVDIKRALDGTLEEAALANAARVSGDASGENRNADDGATTTTRPTGATVAAVVVKSGVSPTAACLEEQPIEKDPELDRDQDIYCVLPTSKLEVTRRPMVCSAESSGCEPASVTRRQSMPIDGDVEQRVQRFQSSTLPNPKRRGDFEAADRGSAPPMPAKRNLLKMTSSQREIDIFASAAGSANPPSSAVDTIPVPKNRRSFTQVFPRPPAAARGPEPIAECPDLPSAVPLKTARGSFGVQVYPAPAPQPRPRRSTGGAEGTSGTSSGRVLARAESRSYPPQDVDITSMKKTVIEQDLQDKLPSVKRLASRFREPVRPGDFQSATLPTPARLRKEKARKKDDDLARRLSQFDSYT